ncbi:hypothetical protein [Streptomyces microflavus]|uniref:hypothetical protein n=1 Tax=Streptomyces microflavus TaxID=1919 RepID=UPI002E313DC0|nr:hypothetical protein [Streptomyces microflavus]
MQGSDLLAGVVDECRDYANGLRSLGDEVNRSLAAVGEGRLAREVDECPGQLSAVVTSSGQFLPSAQLLSSISRSLRG